MKSLLLLAGLAVASAALADGLPTTPYIYVQGTAETRVDPDMLTLNFGLNATDQDQARAKAAVSEKSAAVFKLLEKMAIGEDAIVAAAIAVNENYDFTAGKREASGYTVTRSFTVRLKDLKLYPPLVNALVDLHVESIDPAQPGYSKAAEIKADLKKTAFAQARQEADDIAAGMDTRVTGVFGVSPAPFSEIIPLIFGGTGPVTNPRAFAAKSVQDASGDKYVFDRLTFGERLHVIFLIEPRGK